MKSVLTRAILLVGGLIVLAGVTGSILAKERIKTHGERILLELAPVDPRSMMQGDYMALQFKIAERIAKEARESGAAPIVLDGRGVATLDIAPREDGLRIRYRLQGRQVWLGTNAYFFEEGTASRYVNARYGEFRLDRDSGEAVLTGLRDEKLRPL